MNDLSRRILTFGQLIDLVSADQELHRARRANVASSIRKLLKVSGKTPQMPASFVTVRHVFEAIYPKRYGIDPRRWSNIKSDLRFALERYGAPTRAPLRKDLTPAWQALRTLVDDEPRFVRGLSSVMHWASARGIEPGGISDEVLGQFRQDLENRTLRGRPWRRHQHACKIWNDAAARFTEWPRVTVTVPCYRKQISFAWDAFPASFLADLDAYVRFMSGNDIVADHAPKQRRRPTTLRSHREHIRRFASALVRSGSPMEGLTALAQLTDPNNVKASLATYEKWLGDLTKHPSVFEMVSAITVMAAEYCRAPEEHLDILRRYRNRLRCRQRGFTEKNRERLRPFQDLAVQARFLHLEHALLKKARRMKRPHRQALLVQRVLAHELMLVAPMRIKNLASLHIEKNIRWQGDDKHPRAYLVIQPDDVKNAEHLDYELPEPLVRLLKDYLQTYRPRLLKGPDTGWVFPGAQDDHKHIMTLSEQLCRTVRDHVGVRINVHLYRHIAAFFYLERHPGEYETVRRLLGHKSVDTTMMFYAEFEGLTARKLYASHLLERRLETRGREDGDDR